MAKSEYYVDPLNGSDTTGDGLSDATAWQTVQHALNNITKNVTDGDRINVKDTADDVLTAQLNFSTIGNYNLTFPLLIEGYTSTAGDGGVGGISGGGTTGIITTQRQYIGFRNMHLHNTGANAIINIKRSAVEGCEFNGSSSTTGVAVSEGACCDSYFHDLSGDGLSIAGGVAIGNYFKQGATNSFGSALYANTNSFVVCNIISVDGASNGIETSTNPCTVANNSILGDGGSGAGILVNGNNYASNYVNNLIEGFAHGIYKRSRDMAIVSSNTAFDCNIGFDFSAEFIISNDNTEPAGSPFSKSGSDTFANRFTYFEPVSANAGTNTSGNGSRGAVANPSGGGETSPKHPLSRF